MFNFYDEIKTELKNQVDVFHLVNISNHTLYLEGHAGLITLTKENITFKIKCGEIKVFGEMLYLTELTENTAKISGKIKKVESD